MQAAFRFHLHSKMRGMITKDSSEMFENVNRPDIKYEWKLVTFFILWDLSGRIRAKLPTPRKTEREAKWDRDVTGQNLKFQRKSVICIIALGVSEGKPDGHREKQVSSGFLGNGRIWIIQPFLIPANRVSEVTVSTGLNERRALMSWEWLNKGNETGRYSWLMT